MDTGGKAGGRGKKLKTNHRADSSITDQHTLWFVVSLEGWSQMVCKSYKYYTVYLHKEGNKSNLYLYKSSLLVGSKRPHTYTSFQIPITQPMLQKLTEARWLYGAAEPAQHRVIFAHSLGYYRKMPD